MGMLTLLLLASVSSIRVIATPHDLPRYAGQDRQRAAAAATIVGELQKQPTVWQIVDNREDVTVEVITASPNDAPIIGRFKAGEIHWIVRVTVRGKDGRSASLNGIAVTAEAAATDAADQLTAWVQRR